MQIRTGWSLIGFLAAFVAPATVAAQTHPQEAREQPLLHPLTRIGDNVVDSFTGYNLALHLAAFASTPVLIGADVDMRAHNFWASHQTVEPYSIVGVYLGYGLPVLAAGSLAGYGLIGSSRREVAAASAVAQATVVSLMYQSLLKAFTGRPAPDPYVYQTSEASERFRFGFMRGGIHYGWPSGHMMTTTAVVTSLWPLYPDSLSLRIGSSLLLLGMAASISIHEHASMHWTSDLVAGTLMGLGIGRGVGRGFAERLGVSRAGVAELTVSPVVNSRQTGLSLSGKF